MTYLKEPMLAAREYNPDKQRFPCWGSIKIDGIRCVIKDGIALSRKLKPIPNEYVQRWAYHHSDELEGFDGELTVGPITSPKLFRTTDSAVMSVDGKPDFSFHAFDLWDLPRARFTRRYSYLKQFVLDVSRVQLVHQTTLCSDQDVQDYLSIAEQLGHEGVMLRDPTTLYKMGRATPRSQELVKVKTMVSDEAEVIGFLEQMHNANKATKSETGRTKRSSHKANMHGKGTLGSLQLRTKKGVEFKCGTGMDDDLKQWIWDHREECLGRQVTYKHFPIGAKDKPRQPVFVGFRND